MDGIVMQHLFSGDFCSINHNASPFQPKTKNRQIIEASSANLMLEGKRDAFWFKTRILNSKSRRAIS
jgi:hypothetical protein